MKIWWNNILDNSRHVVAVRGKRVHIGRDPDNDIVLNSPFIAPEALVLYRRQGQWELIPYGLNSCKVGNKEIRAGERYVLDGDRTITLWPFSLTLEFPQKREESREAAHAALDRQMSDLIRTIHREILAQVDVQAKDDDLRRQNDQYLLVLEQHLDEIARIQGLRERRLAALVNHIAGYCVRTQLLESVAQQVAPQANALQKDQHWSRLVTQVPERERELANTVTYFTEQLELKKTDDLSEQADLIEDNFWTTWDAAASRIHPEFKQYLAQRSLKKEIKDILFGYGPLEDLLRMPTISEIMVVDRERIYIEKGGVVENSGRRFISDAVTLSIIERIVSRVGRRIDKSSPLVNARLMDGSRVNAVIPPLAVSGPCLTIRKFPLKRLTIEDLVNKGALTRTVAEFLRAAVFIRRNILVSGGTGTGKTTLLNCLSDFIPDKERIVTIEDTAELQLHKEHVVRLETKEANIEGAGEYSIRELVKNALRMRPDRVVVGECRGGEALDMLQAMNTGHDGSMTTIHANTAEDTIRRLEVLVQMGADLPIESIHQQIASALDLIVQLRRFRDGSRRVVQVTEVVGIDEFHGGIHTRDLFVLEETENKKILAPTGSLPTFMTDLIDKGGIRLASFYR